MTPLPAATVAGDRVALVPVDGPLAALLLAGEADVPAAPDWPHADTADGLALVAPGGARAWLVVHAGRVVGDCGTAGPADAEGVVEIGYGLAPSARGQGLGGEAVRLLVDLLLREPATRGLRAHTLIDNLPSQRVLARAGFALAGVDGALARFARAAEPAA